MVVLNLSCISRENAMFELLAEVSTHSACVTFPAQSTFAAKLLLTHCFVLSYQLDIDVLEMQICWEHQQIILTL